MVAFDDSDQQDAPLWARVVCPFAGQDRGAFLIPDVDDEVLVVDVEPVDPPTEDVSAVGSWYTGSS